VCTVFILVAIFVSERWFVTNEERNSAFNGSNCVTVKLWSLKMKDRSVRYKMDWIYEDGRETGRGEHSAEVKKVREKKGRWVQMIECKMKLKCSGVQKR
jgi:hypothetical protein